MINKMKKALFTVLVVLFAIVAANAQKIDGKWKTSFESPQGAMELTYTFKTDGDKITGSIASEFGDMELTNVKINGDEISYVLDMMGNPITQKGKIEGDVIKLAMDTPDGQKIEMTLKKVQ
jgi:hypothetical protein